MSDNSNNNPSTLGSYVDQATGLMQRTVGSVTGSNSAQNEGAATQQQGAAKNQASHTTAKLGPITTDPHTGATAQDDSSRSNGSWDQTVGSAKESVGNLLGSENLRRQGVEQNASGKEAEAKGQLKDLGQGVTDRAQGKLGHIGAAVTGDSEEEKRFKEMHDEGKTRQRGAEVDIDKKKGY